MNLYLSSTKSIKAIYQGSENSIVYGADKIESMQYTDINSKNLLSSFKEIISF